MSKRRLLILLMAFFAGFVLFSPLVFEAKANTTLPNHPNLSTLPTRSVKPNKFVGILYENWFDGFNNHDYVYPTEAPVGEYIWWGEPARGFYSSSNVATINDQADQLIQAGIDFILLDNSNKNIENPVLWDPVIILLNTYADRVSSGKPTPKIAFLSSFHNYNSTNDLEQLYNTVYTNSAYQNLFFYYGTKPLLLTYDQDVDASGCPTTINSHDANYYFACRRTQGLRNSRSYWSFNELSPQPHYTQNGWAEEMPVSAAQQNQSDYMSRTNTAHGRKWNGSDNTGYQGENFDIQWDGLDGSITGARQVNPTFIIITSWNQWVAIINELQRSPLLR